jgi:hypothetical protein
MLRRESASDVASQVLTPRPRKDATAQNTNALRSFRLDPLTSQRSPRVIRCKLAWPSALARFFGHHVVIKRMDRGLH